MFSFLKSGLMGLSLGAGLFLVGCQSNTPSEPTHMMATDAVQCDKCQVTYIRVPTLGDKNHTIGYTSKPEMLCPDCKDAVANYFSTGNLKHECAACKGNMAICKDH